MKKHYKVQLTCGNCNITSKISTKKLIEIYLPEEWRGIVRDGTVYYFLPCPNCGSHIEWISSFWYGIKIECDLDEIESINGDS